MEHEELGIMLLAHEFSFLDFFKFPNYIQSGDVYIHTYLDNYSIINISIQKYLLITNLTEISIFEDLKLH